tara:strand:+ start:193 stop:366 length:174 start_codon:yes stop_codon:yes gene_type:complete
MSKTMVGRKYIIGFRKIKSLCRHKGIYVCNHPRRGLVNYYCKGGNCPVIKTLSEVRR